MGSGWSADSSGEKNRKKEKGEVILTYVADMFIFYTEPVRTELVGMAVFRGQEMNVEYINT